MLLVRAVRSIRRSAKLRSFATIYHGIMRRAMAKTGLTTMICVISSKSCNLMYDNIGVFRFSVVLPERLQVSIADQSWSFAQFIY